MDYIMPSNVVIDFLKFDRVNEFHDHSMKKLAFASMMLNWIFLIVVYKSETKADVSIQSHNAILCYRLTSAIMRTY